MPRRKKEAVTVAEPINTQPTFPVVTIMSQFKNDTTEKEEESNTHEQTLSRFSSGTQVNYRNFKISEDRSLLTIDKVTTKWKLTVSVKPKNITVSDKNRQRTSTETVEKLSFTLKEITVSELAAYRKLKVPFFVFKENERYYFTKVPENINFLSADILGEHLCAKIHFECQRLDPSPFQKGGCPKVRDTYKRIEKYPFIRVGYEVSNVRQEVFTVINCKYYKSPVT